MQRSSPCCCPRVRGSRARVTCSDGARPRVCDHDQPRCVTSAAASRPRDHASNARVVGAKFYAHRVHDPRWHHAARPSFTTRRCRNHDGGTCLKRPMPCSDNPVGVRGPGSRDFVGDVRGIEEVRVLRVISGAPIPSDLCFCETARRNQCGGRVDPQVLWRYLATAKCSEWGHLARKLRRLMGGKEEPARPATAVLPNPRGGPRFVGRVAVRPSIAARDGFPSRAAVP